MNNTQHEKIIRLMIRRNADQMWFLPQDFMKPELGELFVGYEASARLSELAKDYPFLIASERQGKYMARRIRFENATEVWEKIGPEWHKLLHQEGFPQTNAPVQKPMFDVPPQRPSYF